MSVETFLRAVRDGDPQRVTSLILAGFPAYLHLDTMFHQIFSSGSDSMFDMVVRYLRHHPLNTILGDDGPLPHYQRRIAEYGVYTAIRDGLGDLADRLATFGTTYIDVRLVGRLTRLGVTDGVATLLRQRADGDADADANADASITTLLWDRYVEVPDREYSRSEEEDNEEHRIFWDTLLGLRPDLRDEALTGVLRQVLRDEPGLTFLDGVLAVGHHALYWDLLRDPRLGSRGPCPLPSHYVASCQSGDYDESVRILLACLREHGPGPDQGHVVGLSDLTPDVVRQVFDEDDLHQALLHGLRRRDPDPRLVDLNTRLRHLAGDSDSDPVAHLRETVAREDDVDRFLEWYREQERDPIPTQDEFMETINRISQSHQPRNLRQVRGLVERVSTFTESYSERVQKRKVRQVQLRLMVHDILETLIGASDPDSVVADLTKLLDYARQNRIPMTLDSRFRDPLRLYTGLYHLGHTGRLPLFNDLGPEPNSSRDYDAYQKMRALFEDRDRALGRVLLSSDLLNEDVRILVTQFLGPGTPPPT